MRSEYLMTLKSVHSLYYDISEHKNTFHSKLQMLQTHIDVETDKSETCPESSGSEGKKRSSGDSVDGPLLQHNMYQINRLFMRTHPSGPLSRS